MARATIEDVAKRAGVTKSTVSHALSGKRPVSAETRGRIDAAIAELGYRPNVLAQRLAAGRSGAVGLVYELQPGWPAGEDAAVLSAAHVALSAAGYMMVLCGDSGQDAAGFASFLERGLLDGAVVGQVQMQDRRVSALTEAGLPFVLLGRTIDNAGLAFVDVDIEWAVELGVEHLLGLGHRHIAFLHEDAHISAAAARALQAYERACARRRVRLCAPSYVREGEALRAAATSLLQQHPEVTAVIAAGHAAAWSVHQAAQANGRTAPADLAVVCLGRTATGEFYAPGTTAIDLRTADQVRQAVEVLLELLGEGSPGDRQILLEPRLAAG